MAPPKSRRKDTKQESELLQALRFIAVAQQDIGVPYATHCRFLNGFVTGFDGVLAAGHPVQDEMAICPHTYRLIDALSRAKGAFSLTALDSKQLAIKTDKFRALVDCMGDGDLTYVAPDAAQWPITDEFKKAAAIAGTFNTTGGQTVMAASVVTRDMSVVGTNGTVVIEAWHGCPTPPGLVIPKSFIDALGKVASPMVRFGFTNETFTVHFDNGAWLKTQLYLERYPNVDKILAYTETAKPVPAVKELFEAVKAVASFSADSRVYFGDGKVKSHVNDKQGATYECAEAVHKVALNGKHILALQELMTQVDFAGNETIVAFFGDKLRGALAKMVYPSNTNYDDDIPF